MKNKEQVPFYKRQAKFFLEDIVPVDGTLLIKFEKPDHTLTVSQDARSTVVTILKIGDMVNQMGGTEFKIDDVVVLNSLSGVLGINVLDEDLDYENPIALINRNDILFKINKKK